MINQSEFMTTDEYEKESSRLYESLEMIRSELQEVVTRYENTPQCFREEEKYYELYCKITGYILSKSENGYYWKSPNDLRNRQENSVFDVNELNAMDYNLTGNIGMRRVSKEKTI